MKRWENFWEFIGIYFIVVLLVKLLFNREVRLKIFELIKCGGYLDSDVWDSNVEMK